MQLFEDVELNDAQARAVGRAMLAVARADGAADPREVALIEELAPVDTTSADPTPAELAGILTGAKERELLLRSALLVALVDGDYSAAEGDLLVFGIAGATAADFSLLRSTVAGMGSPAIADLLVIHGPTGQVLWTIADGAPLLSLDLQVEGSAQILTLL